MSNNKTLKIGDVIYVDILDTDNNMLTTLQKDKYLSEKIINITDKYIQTEESLYNPSTNEQLLKEDFTSLFKKFYRTKQELFLEREKFKKYKLIYDAIKNETEYASFLQLLPDNVLDILIQNIPSNDNK